MVHQVNMGIKERKERERGRRRQQIMVAAKRVFSKKSFNKATMEDIAKEAELSPGTIYLYFKNKEELFASLSLRILQYMSIRLEHVHNEKFKEPKEKLNALKDALYELTKIKYYSITIDQKQSLLQISKEYLYITTY